MEVNIKQPSAALLIFMVLNGFCVVQQVPPTGTSDEFQRSWHLPFFGHLFIDVLSEDEESLPITTRSGKSCLGNFYGKFVGKICLKAPGNYSGSFWYTC